MQIGTTEDPSCEQRSKYILLRQYLAFPSPKLYKTKSQTCTSSSFSHGLAQDLSGYFTSITLAWSYIFSCRWVEILRYAGEDSSLWHSRDDRVPEQFWDLVVRSRWMAQVNREKGTFYSPWMLRKGKENVERR
jgi:hypothetical protein